jgi:hypothetical protein
LTTVFVCSDVPDAMFVSAQEASNCSDGLKQTNAFPTVSIGHIHLLIYKRAEGHNGGARREGLCWITACSYMTISSGIKNYV